MTERDRLQRACRRLRSISTLATVLQDELIEIEGDIFGHGFADGRADRVDDSHAYMQLKNSLVHTMGDILEANEHFANRVGILPADD